MNKLICRGGKVSNSILTVEKDTYSNLLDFKWTISVADQYSNFCAQAENNQDSAPYVFISGPNCELEYENTHALWKVVSDGTPAGTVVFFNGLRLPQLMIQVLEVIGVGNKVTLNIVAYGLSAEISPAPGGTLLKSGETKLGGIVAANIKMHCKDAMNEFTLTIEDYHANL